MMKVLCGSFGSQTFTSLLCFFSYIPVFTLFCVFVFIHKILDFYISLTISKVSIGLFIYLCIYIRKM